MNKNIKIPYYLKENDSPSDEMSLEEIHELVRCGHSSFIYEMAKLVETSDVPTEEKYELFKFLPRVSYGISYAESEGGQSKPVYNNLLCLEFNSMNTEVKKIICADEYTAFCDMNPHKKTIEVVVEISNHGKQPESISEMEDFHGYAFEEISRYYENKFNVVVANTGKDVNHLSCISYDAEAYYNSSAKAFPIDGDEVI
jgi:hypothetical protein